MTVSRVPAGVVEDRRVSTGLPARPRPERAQDRTTARWTLRRVFTLGAALATLVTTLAIALGAVALYRLSEARADLLGEVVPAAATGGELSIALLNQETGVRGFGLLPDRDFMAPYQEGRAAEDAAVEALAAHAARTGAEGVGEGVAAVSAAAQRWRDGFVGPTVSGPDVPGTQVDPAVGRQLFDEVRVELAGLQAALNAEQQVARDRVGAAARFLSVVATVIALVLVMSLLLIGIGLRRGVIAAVSGLAAQTRAVVSGDVTRQVHGSGPREIAELGRDVEAMRAHIVSELDAQQVVNRRLDQQARDLARSNRDLEQFAYVASHDLQEPLRKVSSFCRLLQRRYGGQLDERADQYIDFAVDGAQRMQRLINDLLAFSRVGRSTESFGPVPLGEVAADVAAALEPTRAELDGRIEIGELPTVTGDRGLLYQLLMNLVGNAWKFHREGVPPIVTVAAEADSDGWALTVTDNGIGIEPEYADKVFVLFQRLHGRDVYPGTGIGLALADKIVEFHGGRIGLGDPPPGGGTAVRVVLPTTPPDPRRPE